MVEREDMVEFTMRMSTRGYQLLHSNWENDPNRSFDEFIERSALFGSLILRIQETQEGVVVFQGADGEQALIDDKIAEVLSEIPRNVTFFPSK